MASDSERADLRDVKDELVRVMTVQQKASGFALPDPEAAKKYIEKERIIEITEARVPENKARTEAPKVNEHTPDIERNILASDEALARVRAKYGPNADVRIWLHSIRARDPQFAADFDAICAAHLTMEPRIPGGRPVAMFSTLGRLRFGQLMASAIAKYGDPRNPTKHIQVG